MTPILKSFCGGLIALIAVGQAGAADLSPAYVGADVGIGGNYHANNTSGRAYAGYTLGSTDTFGLEQTHSVELMAYSLGIKSDQFTSVDFGKLRDQIRATGYALSWTTSLKISNDWAVNSRLGVASTHATTYSGYGGQYTKDSVSVLAGAGLSYAIAPKWKVVADINYMPFKVVNSIVKDYANVTVGVVRQF